MTALAACALELGTANACVSGLPVTETLPPFDLHPSHTYILCGGYAGCIKCGGVAGYALPTKLDGECKKGCPAGPRGPIGRFARGELPRPLANGTGTVWPSGELCPPVLAYHPPESGRLRASVLPDPEPGAPDSRPCRARSFQYPEGFWSPR